ncbi:MAG: hypothetical protein GX823_00705, partial [Clostridiales bacterium]|nr:hypothetical protein [Clostridiales bacterium]
MKKLLVILLVLALAFTLFACGDNGTPSTTPTPDSGGSTTPDNSGGGGGGGGGGSDPVDPGDSGGGSPYPNANPDGSINLDTIAHYDSNYDYTQNERVKSCYIAQDGGPLYQMSAVAYEHWSPLMNMDWVGFLSSNGDAVLYMDILQQQLDQGVKCFILDPDTTIVPAVVELMDKYPDAAWMTQMAAPRDGATGEGLPPGGNMVNSYVGHDNAQAGIDVSKKVIEWKEKNFPDVPWEEVGFLVVAFSTSPPLQERVDASRAVWLEKTGLPDNFFVADAATYGINYQGGLDAVSPVITTNTHIKYWIGNGLIDDFAQAAATVIDQMGLTDNSCIAAFGGSGAITQWDSGQDDSFRYALFTAQTLYGEPIIGGVYACLQGWATPDTLWPSWVKWDDHGADGHTYSKLMLPTVGLEYNECKDYLEWRDLYANATSFNYPEQVVSIDD